MRRNLSIIILAAGFFIVTGMLIKPGVKDERIYFPPAVLLLNPAGEIPIEKPWEFLFDTSLVNGFHYPVIPVPDCKTKVCRHQTMDSDSLCRFTFTSVKQNAHKIYSSSRGKVVRVSDSTVVINHLVYENSNVKNINLVYEGFDSVFVKEGEWVNVNHAIGEIRISANTTSSFTMKIITVGEAELSFPDKNKFLIQYKQINLPADDELLLIAVKHQYRMYLFSKGKIMDTIPIALSQDPVGHKVQQGDNKTPEGEYFIREKEAGPFYSSTGPWLGTRWMQISYPNRYDALNGFKDGRITRAEYQAIINAHNSKVSPTGNTKLGGDIGIHGWNGDWIDDGTQNLTWGCISLLNHEMEALYAKIPMHTRVIVLP